MRYIVENEFTNLSGELYEVGDEHIEFDNDKYDEYLLENGFIRRDADEIDTDLIREDIGKAYPQEVAKRDILHRIMTIIERHEKRIYDLEIDKDLREVEEYREDFLPEKNPNFIGDGFRDS